MCSTERTGHTSSSSMYTPPVEVDGWQICVQPVCVRALPFFFYFLIYLFLFFFFSFSLLRRGLYRRCANKQQQLVHFLGDVQKRQMETTHTSQDVSCCSFFFFLFCFLVSSQQTLTDSPVCPYHQFERRNNHIFSSQHFFSGCCF